MNGSEVVGMVLCAGLGTRLRPLTELLPKPAVAVCGLPLIEIALAQLSVSGIHRAVVNTHHLPQIMEKVARTAAERSGMKIAVSHEPVIAGTGGAFREARHELEGAAVIVVWNGDILFDLDLKPVLEAHRASGALATMVVMPIPAGERYAAVEVDAQGAVRRIAGRFGPGGEGLTPYHFTGVHLLSPRVLEAIPVQPFECDIRKIYATLMDGRLRAVQAGGYWNDLGTPERYLQANVDLLRGGARLLRSYGADPFADLEPLGNPGAWAGRGVRLSADVGWRAPLLIRAGSIIEAGAEIGPDAIIGANCRISAGAVVRDAVVLDDTVVTSGEKIVGQIAAGEQRIQAREAVARA